MSAILLDQNYYDYTLQHGEIKEAFMQHHKLICLKHFATIPNESSRSKCKNVEQKTQKTMFRMVMMLERKRSFFDLPDTIKLICKVCRYHKEDLPSQIH
jgi:hypothetical protein